MLYKYLPPERIDVLENLKIRFSPLKSLNDPYESRPLLSVPNQNEIIEESIKEINELWATVKKEDKTVKNIIAYEKSLKEIQSHHQKTFNKFNLANILMEYFNDSQGVLSL